MTITAKHKKKLKALGHSLTPLINIGKEEISEGVIKKTRKELEQHELIQIKVQNTTPMPVKFAAEKLSEETGCTIIKIIGSTALLFKRNEDEPVIKFD